MTSVTGRGTAGLALLGVAINVLTSQSFAQICEVTELQKIASPADPITTGYAKAVAISGNTVIVGDETASAMGAEAGAAYAYTFDGSQWLLTQTLYASENFPFQHFGASVAIDGEIAIIGTRPFNEGGLVHHGAAHVFTLNQGQWVHHVKLADETFNDPPEIPGEQQVQRRFGAAVAISGETVLIGAPQDCTQMFGAGAVYHYEVEGGDLVFKQKLFATTSEPSDQFGFGVAVDGTSAIIAAPGVGNGAAYFFDFDEERWQQSQSVALPNGMWPTGAVAPLDLSGDFAALGSPLAVVSDISSGSAFVLKRESGVWSFMSELISSTSKENGRFGTSVAIEGNFLAIGAPREDVILPMPSEHAEEAGAVHLYEHVAGDWQTIERMVAEFDDVVIVHEGGGWASGLSNEFTRMGASIALDAGLVIAGAPTSTNVDDDFPASAWFAFQAPAEDCDTNGVPDPCDTDCNHNRVPDACELAAGSVMDCDGNGIPDECDISPHYFNEPGSDYFTTHGSFLQPLDVIWLNQFTVTPGHETITHIVIPWTAGMPDGHSAKLLVYDDPNNDGDPHDAALLATHDVMGFNDNGFEMPLRYSIYAITPTHVGSAGSSFFIGAYVQCPSWVLPVVGTGFANVTGRSWHTVTDFGKGDYIDLSANGSLIQPDTNYMLHALAMDCNGNGAWDQCDIDSGFSEDTNTNGIPDECEPPCGVADITGNGVIDVDDLLAVINAWGACEAPPAKCPSDLTADGIVDVDDLLTVVKNWGPCV